MTWFLVICATRTLDPLLVILITLPTAIVDYPFVLTLFILVAYVLVKRRTKSASGINQADEALASSRKWCNGFSF